MLIFHYTDRSGYNQIRSGPTWMFRAHQPPPRDPDHPTAAYFTTLGPETRHLAARLRIPAEKLAYIFVFEDAGDLVPLRGGRGQYILYATADYVVGPERQHYHGESGPLAAQRRAPAQEET